jgi:hypothetical protein
MKDMKKQEGHEEKKRKRGKEKEFLHFLHDLHVCFWQALLSFNLTNNRAAVLIVNGLVGAVR